jgi:LAO/AO transport system kinase
VTAQHQQSARADDATGTEVLAQKLLSGDRRVLARAITLVEDRDPNVDRLVQLAFARTGRARTIGVTGPPGVGKSTLIDALIAAERKRKRSVGVLSVDPSSSLTSGALLGDRLRMSRHFVDPQVFIRSMATRGALGGLARAASQAVMLMDAAGFDVVFLETVGVGQSEIDIATSADTVVLVLMPGAGDSIQALKSGVMEIPDIIVVNRANDSRARATLRHVRDALSLRPKADWNPPLLLTEASAEQGVDALEQALDAHHRFLESGDRLFHRRRRNLEAEIAKIAVGDLTARVDAALRSDDEVAELLDAVARRDMTPLAAAQHLLARVGST